MGREGFLDVIHLYSFWSISGLPKQTVNENLQKISGKVVCLLGIWSWHFIQWTLLSGDKERITFSATELTSGSDDNKVSCWQLVFIDGTSVHVVLDGLDGLAWNDNNNNATTIIRKSSL